MQLALLSLIIIANLHSCSFSWKQHILLLLAWSCPETLDLKDLSHKSIWWAFQEVQTFAKFWPYLEFQFPFSLCSKHFCFVFRAKQDQGMGFWFWPHENRNKNQKMKEGGGEGRKPYLTFLLQPLPIFYSCHFSHSFSFAPKPHRNTCYEG